MKSIHNLEKLTTELMTDIRDDMRYASWLNILIHYENSYLVLESQELNPTGKDLIEGRI